MHFQSFSFQCKIYCFFFVAALCFSQKREKERSKRRKGMSRGGSRMQMRKLEEVKVAQGDEDLITPQSLGQYVVYKAITRANADQELLGAAPGCFLVRPSSKRRYVEASNSR